MTRRRPKTPTRERHVVVAHDEHAVDVGHADEIGPVPGDRWRVVELEADNARDVVRGRAGELEQPAAHGPGAVSGA